MKSRKRVLVVLNYFFPYISGVSEYARMLVELLGSHHDVTVLTGRHLRSLPLEESTDGYRIVRARPLFYLHKGYLSLEIFEKYRHLVKSADIVNIHMPMLEAGLLASLTPDNVPIIATYQCDVQRTGGWLDAAAVASVNCSSAWGLRKSAVIIASSKDYADGSPLLSQHSARIIEGYVPLKSTERGPDPSLYRGASDCFTVGFLGRFVEEKGLHVLLEAAKQVVAVLPRSQFLLAGENAEVAGGAILERVAPLIEGLGAHVRILGRLPESHLAGFYSSLDVLALPSINAYEAFGMVQVEAMLAGTPVVASDLRGVRVPIQRTDGGWLVEAGNASALAALLVGIGTGKLKKSRESVRSSAAAEFSNEAFVCRYLETIETLTDVASF